MGKTEGKKLLGEFTGHAKETAKKVTKNIIQRIDQNDDGKFDMSDVAKIKETTTITAQKSVQAAQDGIQAVVENVQDKRKVWEAKALAPIFSEDLEDVDFHRPKFIRVVDRSKKYMDKEVCQGSIGYRSSVKGFEIIHLFRDSVVQFGIRLVPDNNGEFYYVDPSERNRYIALDDYFGYLKVARISELQMIAQELGAKYFKVTYKEEQVSFSGQKRKGKAKVVGAVETENDSSEKRYSTVEIAAEMSFPGHEPVEPQLNYLKKDTSIQALVSMRLHERGALLNQKYMLKLSNTSGLKEKDAVKIDAILKGLKCSGNTTVESEVKNEARRFLEYDIRF